MSSIETGGYEYKFVDNALDRYVCNICHLPSRNPYLSVCCGHVFCKSCLESFKSACTPKINLACPVCRDRSFVTFPNKQLDREVKDLHVMCTNYEKGCEWQGELNDITNHLGNSGGCQFEDVKCPNECGVTLERQYLTSHIEMECPRRMVYCWYCQIVGEHQFIVEEHGEHCAKFPLPCPNNCDVGSVCREDMEAHRKECPLEMVQCEYHEVGCEEWIMRKDLEKHKKDKMEKHLALISSELARTKSLLATSTKQLNTMIIVLHEMAITQGHAKSAASIRSVADWPIKLTIMAALTKSGGQICSVILDFTEFNKKRRNQIEWYSCPFFSHKTGYKMCLNICAAGHGSGKGTHMSVFLYLMKGPHDDELTWPLRGKFEVKLLNQISDCEHHTKKMTFTNNTRVTIGNRAKSGWGYQQFISKEDLHKVTPTCQYLKDDCIFLQVGKL